MCQSKRHIEGLKLYRSPKVQPTSFKLRRINRASVDVPDSVVFRDSVILLPTVEGSTSTCASTPQPRRLLNILMPNAHFTSPLS